jgi:SAM-dependent methyltransferase
MSVIGSGDPVSHLVRAISQSARRKRAQSFRDAFVLDENTRILDLGSENGCNIHAVLQGTRVKPQNVYIADICKEAVETGAKRFGFVPVYVDESGPMPFPDRFFDVVYCSSVIEHVTVPKHQVWHEFSGKKFREAARKRQKEFSDEIRRLGRQYFVQTPYCHFPVESHSWLPFIAWVPRRLQLPILRLSNALWVKQTDPDWCLLNRADLAGLFDDARIVEEKLFGLTKSIIAVKSVTLHSAA